MESGIGNRESGKRRDKGEERFICVQGEISKPRQFNSSICRNEMIPDSRFPIPDSHPYLSFNVESPISARIVAMIQKRMTTVGSCQPSFSKWW